VDGRDVPFHLSRLLERLGVDEGNIPEDTVVVAAAVAAMRDSLVRRQTGPPDSWHYWVKAEVMFHLLRLRPSLELVT
jgi:hypothetical protein